MKPISLGIAGSTYHTQLCAEALLAHPNFEIRWVLTPSPKKIGRHQALALNPVQNWAKKHQISTFFVEKKIDQAIRSQIESTPPVDVLLVVDFGYLVPGWLLKWPQVAPVNIHPSLLPRWRGSSPGQFCLLYGDTDSAVTVIQMAAGMDTGPIIAQLPFTVQEGWTSHDYYQFAFGLITAQLPELLQKFVRQPELVRPQPKNSPTPTAGRLNRADGFVSWQLLKSLVAGQSPDSESIAESSALLHAVQNQTGKSWPKVLENAVAGLSPWPGVWSLDNSSAEAKRVKILEVEAVNDQTLALKTIQKEGEKPKNVSGELLTQLF